MYVLLFRRRFILAKPFPYNTLLQIYCIVLFRFRQCFSENFRNFVVLHNIFKNHSRSLHTVESFQAVFYLNLYNTCVRNFIFKAISKKTSVCKVHLYSVCKSCFASNTEQIAHESISAPRYYSFYDTHLFWKALLQKMTAFGTSDSF